MFGNKVYRQAVNWALTLAARDGLKDPEEIHDNIRTSLDVHGIDPNEKSFEVLVDDETGAVTMRFDRTPAAV